MELLILSDGPLMCIAVKKKVKEFANNSHQRVGHFRCRADEFVK